MRLIYTPEDGEKQEFSFVPARLMSPEAEAIENVGGDAWESFDEFGIKFMKGNRRAYRAALWIMLRRSNPALKFAHLVIRMDEISIDFDQPEREAIRAAIVGDEDMDESQRARLLSEMDGAEAAEKKDLSHSDESSTGSGSPEPDSPAG